ncbi:MAG: hypothetical protein DSY82_08425 [Flavobacteriia bacterium]|nr:MAG: hypothetical protein DSY82_08425 [Flavobacteriia bacterium]
MNILKKIAAALAALIGLMSIFAGSKVLLGIDTKDYNILTWLVVYNVVMGIVSLFAAYMMWKNNYRANNIITFILTLHFLIFLYLRFFSDTAAHESQMAMLFRSVVWVVISILYIQVPRMMNKKQTAS